MKTTYKCEICGFSSQNKEEVQRCEEQGVKSKFSVGEEVEWLNEFDKEKKQWVRATIVAVHFEERTHKIGCYNIKPEREILVTAHKQGPVLVFEGGSVNEEELRPVAKEENERIEAVNSLVRVYIERGNLDKAQEAAQLGRRNLSTEEINSLVKVCAQKGWLQEAQKGAKLAGRELTTEEINLLIEACAKEGKIDVAQERAKLAGRKLTTKEIDFLVEALIIQEKKQEKYRGEALKAARLGASKEVLNSLVKLYIEWGFENEAREAAKLAGRELTKEENEAMLRFYIKYGCLSSAQRNAQRIGRNLTREEIDSLVKACVRRVLVDWHDFVVKEAFKATELEASKEVIEEAFENLIKHFLKKGLIDYALKLAELRGRPLSTEEIDLLVMACIKNGSIYESCLKKDAFKAVKLGASKETIESLVGAYIKKGWISEAQEVARLAGRELTAEEIGKFIETR